MSRIFCEVRAFTTSDCMRDTMAAGVATGAKMPCHAGSYTNPGMPASDSVGTSGKPTQRLPPLVANTRIRPDLMCCTTVVGEANAT